MTPFIFGVTQLLTISAPPALFNSRTSLQLTRSPAPSLDLPTSWRPARLIQAQLRLQLGSTVPLETPRHGRSLRPSRGSSFALQVRLCTRTASYRGQGSKESLLFRGDTCIGMRTSTVERSNSAVTLIQLRMQLIVENNFTPTVFKVGWFGLRGRAHSGQTAVLNKRIVTRRT
jgi:hypothetical protein